MTDPPAPLPPAAAPRPRSRALRLVSLVGAALVLLLPIAVEIAWVVYANRRLASGDVLERLNRRPDRVRVAWDHARSWYPGQLLVDDLDVSGTTRRKAWHVTCRSARFRLGLTGFFHRRVDVESADLDVLRVRVRPREQDQETPSRPAEPPPAVPHAPSRAWLVDVHRVTVHGFAEAWVGPVRVLEAGNLVASFRVEPRRSIDLAAVAWKADAATVDLDDRETANHLRVDAALAMPGWTYVEERGQAGLRHLSGHARLSGALTSLDLLRFVGLPEIRARLGAPAGIAADLRLENGQILAGSSATLEASRFTVGVLRVQLAGRAELKAEVARDGGADTLRVRTSVRDLALGRGDEPVPDARGPLATLEISARDVSLASGAPGRTIDLDCPNLSLPDIGRLQPLLPPGGPVRLVSGAARANLALTLHDGRSGTAHVWLQGQDVSLEAGGESLVTNLELEARPTLVDAREGTATCDHTTLALTDVRVNGERPDSAPWDLRLEVPRGRLDLGHETRTDADFRLTMTDSRPITAWIQGGRHASPWLRLIPVVRDLRGDGRIVTAGSSVQLDKVTLTGRGFEGRTVLNLDHGHANGVAFMQWGPLAAGLDLHDSHRDWKLTHARDWFADTTGWQEVRSGRPR